jgi:predicted DNA-binding transcriptional regulator AlpA
MPFTKKSGNPGPDKIISRLDGLPELLTRGDVAELLSVHTETVKRLEREKKLPPPLRITSKTIRHQRSSIEKFLKEAAAK